MDPGLEQIVIAASAAPSDDLCEVWCQLSDNSVSLSNGIPFNFVILLAILYMQVRSDMNLILIDKLHAVQHIVIIKT